MPLMKYYRNVHRNEQTRKEPVQKTIKNPDGKDAYIVSEVKRVKQSYYKPFKVWLRENHSNILGMDISRVEDSEKVQRVCQSKPETGD